MEPWLPDALGCGRSPCRPLPVSDDTMRTREGDRGLLGPLERVEAGLSAYPQLGHGSLLLDWDCCPRWHGQLSEATLGGQMAALYARRATTWRDKGSLGLLLGAGEPTSAVIEAIALTDTLDAEQSRMDREERESAESRRRRERTRGS